MQGFKNGFAVGQLRAEAVAKARGANFHGAQAFLQGFLKGAANAHGFAHALHGGGELVLGTGKFFKGKARNLHHAVVDGGLKARHGFAGNVVVQLVEGIAHGQLGGDFGNRKARGLGGQRRRTRHAGVHFDNHDLAVGRVDAELHVTATRFNADFAHNGNGGVADVLVFDIRKGLHRGHGDGIARVHAHGIKIFNGADDDAVVLGVTHHFHFNFFPAKHALLNHDFRGGAGRKTIGSDGFEVFHVVGHAAARAAKRKGRAHNKGEGQLVAELAHVFDGAGNAAGGHIEADVFHGLAEQFAALGFFDNVGACADKLNAAFRQNAALGKPKSGVQSRLTAKRRQESVGALFSDDCGKGLLLDGFHIGGVSHMRIGHDGSRIGIDQHHLVPFFLEGLHGL